MEADKLTLLMIEEVVNDTARSKMFSKLNMFAIYQQMKSAESVREKTVYH